MRTFRISALDLILFRTEERLKIQRVLVTCTLVLSACSEKTRSDPAAPSIDTATKISPLTRIAHAVPVADRQNNYLAACGFPPSVANFDKLPDLAVRGDHGKAAGEMSNGWELIEKFENNTACLASAAGLKASLWYRSNGGFEMFYLFRFPAGAPAGAGTLNGVLAFKKDGSQVKGCAWDSLRPLTAPADFRGLFYAGQVPGTQMDDCSACHIHAYNAPRPKMLDVANNPRFDWLTNAWKPAAARFGDPEQGVEWIVGPKDGAAPGPAYAIEGVWLGGTGANAGAGGSVGANCRTCHKQFWVKPRASAVYCPSVFQPAFDKTTTATGSMMKIGEQFQTKENCRVMFNAIGGCSAAQIDARCGTAAPGAPKGPAVAVGPTPEWLNRNIVIAKSGPDDTAHEWDEVKICFDAVTVPSPGRVMKYATIAARNFSGSPLIGVEPDTADMLVDEPPQKGGRITSRIFTRTAYDPAAEIRNFNIHATLEDDPEKVWFILGALVDQTGVLPSDHAPHALPLSGWLSAADAVYNGCETPGSGLPDAQVADASDAGYVYADGGDGGDGGDAADADAYYVYYPDADEDDVYDAGDAGIDSGIPPSPSDGGSRDASSRDAINIFGFLF